MDEGSSLVLSDGVGEEFTGFAGEVRHNGSADYGVLHDPWRQNVSGALCLGDGASLSRPPFVCCWSEADTPLPLRIIRAPARPPAHPLPMAGRPWLATGPAGRPFDFCGQIKRLCADITVRCEALCHVDVARLLFAVTQARTGRTHGLQARLTPLR